MTKRIPSTPKASLLPPIAFAYVRVSTGRQAEEGLSLDAQERQLIASAELAGYRVEVIREEGKSAKNIRNRPALKGALERLKNGNAEALYVAHIDRLARSVSDLLGVVDSAEKEGWRLSILNLGLDTKTPHGRLVLSMLGSVAEFERGLIAERAKDTHAERRARGEVWGVDKGQMPLVPIEVLIQIRTARESGDSLRTIAARLNAEGVPSGRGGTWYASTIKHLLEAPRAKQEAA